MSRLQIALKHRMLYASDDVVLRAELALLLKDGSGNWQPQLFRVDPGTEMSTMPAYDAHLLNLPMPLHPVLGAIHRQSGLEFRSGYFRARVVGMDQTEYVFPCFFLGDPLAPPNPKVAIAALPRNLFGLSGVIDKLRIVFDDDPGPGAPYGHLIVEKK